MVITDRFVFIHVPKTGGTFVTHALERLHGVAPAAGPAGRAVRIRRLLERIIGRGRRYGKLSNIEPKHGTCDDIPAEHRGKRILSVVRNPYDWYVSQYEFGWWKRTFEYHPEPNPTPAGSAIEQVLPAFEDDHPHFPEISFEEFLDLCDRAAAVLDEASADPGSGLYTHGFLRYFGAVAHPVVSAESGGTVTSDGARGYDAHFMRTDRLNEDLPAFLLSMGYRPEDVTFIRALGRILPMGRGRTANQHWERYYSPAMKASIRARDARLFELFPDFDDTPPG
jgi:hypothetical protein